MDELSCVTAEWRRNMDHRSQLPTDLSQRAHRSFAERLVEMHHVHRILWVVLLQRVTEKQCTAEIFIVRVERTEERSPSLIGVCWARRCAFRRFFACVTIVTGYRGIEQSRRKTWRVCRESDRVLGMWLVHS